MERETRFELATLALARRCSTTELLPLVAELSIPAPPKPGQPPAPHAVGQTLLASHGEPCFPTHAAMKLRHGWGARQRRRAG